MENLWHSSKGEAYGLSFEEFREILMAVGSKKSFGLTSEGRASDEQKAAFFARLKLTDLVLARGCSLGRQPAWEHFMRVYRQPLINAGIAITGSQTLGHDLADSLYAELYGLTSRDGQRRSPLNSYDGAGPLKAWLCTMLAQRNVDNHRRTRREAPLGDYDGPAACPEPTPSAGELQLLRQAVEEAIRGLSPDERFLLNASYIDKRTLKQIAVVLGFSEAKISRDRERLTADLRQRVLRNLQVRGLSKAGAQEALGIDPRDLDRDLDMFLRKLLQNR